MKILQDRQNKTVLVEAEKYRLKVDPALGWAELADKSGHEYFRFPLDVEVALPDGERTQMPLPLSASVKEGEIKLLSAGAGPWAEERITIKPTEEFFVLGYSAQAREAARVCECRLFYRDSCGMLLRNMYQGFNPSPLHGKNALEDLYSLTPTVDTANSYYTPAPLNVGIGMPGGWVGIGMVDLPNGTTFGFNNTWGLLVDEPWGHIVTPAGGEYTAPRVVFTFPSDEWDGIAAYRTALLNLGTAATVPIEEKGLPDWWKRPMYCTYGDQILEHQPYWLTDWYWGSPNFTSDWVRDAVSGVEKRLGYKEFTVIIDAFWMDKWDADPTPSSRFPDMRKLIDWLHERGHKVLLWYFPFETCLENGCGEDARRFGVLPPETPPDAKNAPIDVTSPNFPAYAAYVAERLFGSDGLDADGLKIDFLAHLRHPRGASYQNPDAGIGIKEGLRWLKIFGEAARSIKPDVHLNWSAADPHFEGFFNSNRTHDTHFTPEEFERRVRIASLAAPNGMINFDGCLMRPEWFDSCYLPAALYGTPSLYYSRRFHGGKEVEDEQLQVLGRLFEICARREWGRVRYLSPGCWRLENGNGIAGETVDGKTLILKDGRLSATIFSMEDAVLSVPLLGLDAKGIDPVPHGLKIEDGTATALWKRGKAYKVLLNR